MNRDREHEEPFGFDGRSLEEQLASLSPPGSEHSRAQHPAEGESHPPGARPQDRRDARGTARDPYESEQTSFSPEEGPQDPEGEAADPGGAEVWGSWRDDRRWHSEAGGPAEASEGASDGDAGHRDAEHPLSREDPRVQLYGAPAQPMWGTEYAQPWSGDPSWGQPAEDSEPGWPAEAAQAPRFPEAPPADGEPWPAQAEPPEPPRPRTDPYADAAPEPPHPGTDPYAGAAPEQQPGRPPHEHPGPAQDVPPAPPQTADSLKPETLLRGRRRAPAGGWRRAVYRASGGLVHPGESPAELHRRELTARARTVVARGHHRVAVVSLKGGVGKTTTTIGLGSTLAALRGDRVVAIDANPDRGTLSDKLRLETAATVRDLLNERDSVRRYADVRAFTSQAPSRLEVLASDRDPAVSEAFSEEDYRAVASVLEHFYSICITDSGTGLLHSAMSGVLRLADQIVLVSSPSVDGARSASATLDWLEAHEFGGLVRNATVVLSAVNEDGKSTVDLTRLEQHFASRCNAVVRVPSDPHLEEGAEVELDELKPATREAYLLLAATVAGNFGHRRGVPVSSSPAGGDGYLG